jgi:hypothetical protein
MAAHITAASPGGPRYDPSLTPEARSGADNGIWLCHNHGKLVDNDRKRFTVEVLRRWKADAEAEDRDRVGNTAAAASNPGIHIEKHAMVMGDIHAQEVHFNSSIHSAVLGPQSLERTRPLENIKFINTGTISLEEVLGGRLYEKGSLNNGIVIRFANEPRPGNAAVSIRAVVRYSIGESELCETTGLWLGSQADTEEFQPDGRRHTLIVGALCDGQFAAIDTERIQAHRRTFLQSESKPLKDFQSGTIFVRLLNARSNQVLFEASFLANTHPLSIEPKRAITPTTATTSRDFATPSKTPMPNFQYVAPKEKRVFISPLAKEGICDPRSKDERENSVRALVLKFENKVQSGLTIARALNVIAKIRFKSKGGSTEQLVDYGVWLNSPCNCTDMREGDTRELVLMCEVNDELLCVSDRRKELHNFYDGFSYFESSSIDGFEQVEVTLNERKSQSTLNCQFRIWRDGSKKLCISKL